LKKLRDETASKGTDFNDEFNPSVLAVSLIIGATAGVIAGLALGNPSTIDAKFALGIMSSGYAGADFIEGFMSRQAANLGGAATPAGGGGGGGGGAAAPNAGGDPPVG
jgi:hypothetical protein